MQNKQVFFVCLFFKLTTVIQCLCVGVFFLVKCTHTDTNLPLLALQQKDLLQHESDATVSYFPQILHRYEIQLLSLSICLPSTSARRRPVEQQGLLLNKALLF